MAVYQVCQRDGASYRKHETGIKDTFGEACFYAIKKTPPVREGSLVKHPSISSMPIPASEFDPDTHDGPEWAIVETG